MVEYRQFGSRLSMKKFAYKFSKTGIAVLIIGLICAVVCVALNIMRLVRLLNSEVSGVKDYATTSLSILIGVAGIIVIIPVIASSAYQVDKDNLTTRMGLIKTKIKISAITRVTLFRYTSKLVVYYNQSDYVAINIAETDYDSFVDALKEINSKIFYAIDTENSGEPD